MRLIQFFKNLTKKETLTFRYDTTRLSLESLYLTLEQSVFVLITISYFNASDFYKALVQTGVPIGRTLALFFLTYIVITKIKKTHLVAAINILVAVFLLLATFGDSVEAYVILATLAMIFFNFRSPIITSIHKDSYSKNKRARLFSVGHLISGIMILLFAGFVGYIVELDSSYFRYVLIFVSAIVALSAWFTVQIPSSYLYPKKSKNFLHEFRFIKEDRLFRGMLISWFILGLANLAAVAIQVAYMKETTFLSDAQIVWLVSGCSALVNIIFMPLWARAFDKYNVLVIRIIANIMLLIGLVLFFMSDNLTVIIIGFIIRSIGLSSGTILWSLWVTRAASPKNTQSYMAIHSFFTGVRGIIAPFIGFYIYRLGVVYIEIYMIAMMAISTATFYWIYRNKELSQRLN